MGVFLWYCSFKIFLMMHLVCVFVFLLMFFVSMFFFYFLTVIYLSISFHMFVVVVQFLIFFFTGSATVPCLGPPEAALTVFCLSSLCLEKICLLSNENSPDS